MAKKLLIKNGYAYIQNNNALLSNFTTSGKKIINNLQNTDVKTYTTAQVVDANLIAANIKKGINILGIDGSFGLNPTISGEDIAF